MDTRVRNNLFDAKKGLSRGRPLPVEALWYLTKILFFLSPLPWPSRFKCILLRCFGAKIGKGVYLKPRVNIHLPWKLKIGDYTWLGEEVFILNLEPVEIGRHCCLSQRAFICTGNHDYTKIEMPYQNRPIVIADGVWVGAQVFVGPGVRVNTDCVLAAGSVVTKDMPEGMICAGNPCQSIRHRWKGTC
jgi:putative colanic acid biosynthesis acetyltransferase WcaF